MAVVASKAQGHPSAAELAAWAVTVKTNTNAAPTTYSPTLLLVVASTAAHRSAAQCAWILSNQTPRGCDLRTLSRVVGRRACPQPRTAQDRKVMLRERPKAPAAWPRGSVPSTTQQRAEELVLQEACTRPLRIHSNPPWTQGCELSWWPQFQVPAPNAIHTQRAHVKPPEPSRSSQVARGWKGAGQEGHAAMLPREDLACDVYFQVYYIARAVLNYAPTTRCLSYRVQPEEKAGFAVRRLSLHGPHRIDHL